VIDVRIDGRSTDIWFGSRRVARLTRRRSIYGPLTALYAHRDGGPLLKEEARGLKKLRYLCGALVSTGRGSVLLQWRGWGA